MPTPSTPPAQQQPEKKNHFVLRVILWSTVIVILALILFFASRVNDYVQQVRTDSVDLSQFEKGGITALTTENPIPNIDNSFVANVTDDPSVGPEDAVLTIVAFEDFECPFCGQVFPTFTKIINKYSNRVRFVYRDFPLSDIHASAQVAAEAGQCANAQGQFWPYHDLLFQNQDNLASDDLMRYAAQLKLDTVAFDNCLRSGEYTSEVQADFNDGLKAGVTGTPTFFFNGNRVAGVITENGFEQIINHFLSTANSQ